MTDSLTVYQDNRSLLAAEMTDQIKEMARKLMKLTPNGGRLSAEEATDLAVFVAINNLNPFAGEAYYLPGSGPVIGAVAYRRIAQEWLDNQYGKGHRFWIDFEVCEPGTAVFDPAKDIAYRATLHIGPVKERWEQRILGAMIDMAKAGVSMAEAKVIAKELIGPEPVWEAVGVVLEAEKFSRDGRPEKWDRHERAQKRAEKAALKKAFPAINFPKDAEDGANLNYTETRQAIVREISQEPAPRTPQQIEDDEARLMQELGYN